MLQIEMSKPLKYSFKVFRSFIWNSTNVYFQMQNGCSISDHFALPGLAANLSVLLGRCIWDNVSLLIQTHCFSMQEPIVTWWVVFWSFSRSVCLSVNNGIKSLNYISFWAPGNCHQRAWFQWNRNHMGCIFNAVSICFSALHLVLQNSISCTCILTGILLICH